jgi:hypothetical protein
MLLSASEDEFGQKDYANANLDEIATHAGRPSRRDLLIWTPHTMIK